METELVLCTLSNMSSDKGERQAQRRSHQNTAYAPPHQPFVPLVGLAGRRQSCGQLLGDFFESRPRPVNLARSINLS